MQMMLPLLPPLLMIISRFGLGLGFGFKFGLRRTGRRGAEQIVAGGKIAFLASHLVRPRFGQLTNKEPLVCQPNGPLQSAALESGSAAAAAKHERAPRHPFKCSPPAIN